MTLVSFWFALILSLGSLLFYLVGAFLYRAASAGVENPQYDFNLGIPEVANREKLFAITLVAAGTSLSTVFVFFLTAGPVFGWWVLLCPVMFALGNLVMFVVYKRTHARGYFKESDAVTLGKAGLIPYLGHRLTGNKVVGWLLVLLSAVNLLAVLVLELVVGVDVFGYLARHTFNVQVSSWLEFGIFAISVVLLLGYVFVGGFRAVVASDVWQMKAMILAVVLTIVSMIIFSASSGVVFTSAVFHKIPPALVLWGFIINVVLANIFCPLSQESSWQRFRAFAEATGFDTARAMIKSVWMAAWLWLGLIFLSFSLLLVLPSTSLAGLNSMSNVLEAFRTLNDWWFPLFVFPILTVAALSAMYSTADTCVSALLYLIDYSQVAARSTRPSTGNKISKSYYLAMLLVFGLCLSVYALVRICFNPTIFQLIFSVFSNLVVVAPTVITTMFVSPHNLTDDRSSASPYIIASLILGSAFYWTSAITAIVVGQSFLWLSQLSIALGLLGAILPVIPIWLRRKA
jgi:Na+/proline symporter